MMIERDREAGRRLRIHIHGVLPISGVVIAPLQASLPQKRENASPGQQPEPAFEHRESAVE
jgi:hypothetical protein